MRKLKAHRIVGMNEECARIENDFYLKSEADKVIAELKNENERLKEQSSCTFSDDCLRLRQTKRKLRHQKYKRCMAMANGCEYLCAHYQFREVYEKRDFFRKWMFRWFTIAEQFKEQR